MAPRSIKFGVDVRESLLRGVDLAENAGEGGAIIAGKVLDRDSDDYGSDAQNSAFTDMVAGIIDPTKVVRIALQNAASVAGLLITAEAMVSELSDKAPDGARPGHVA